MTEAETLALVRENERMKSALNAIKAYCERAIFGAWRQIVYDLTNQGLGKSDGR